MMHPDIPSFHLQIDCFLLEANDDLVSVVTKKCITPQELSCITKRLSYDYLWAHKFRNKTVLNQTLCGVRN